MDSLHKIESVGFTGTRKGMSNGQRFSFRKLIREVRPRFFHHGGCEGADASAHGLVLANLPNTRVTVHPPLVRTFAMDVRPEPMVEILTPKPYLVRNKDIVQAAGLLIATPFERDELLRSGTWSTIRWARHQKCPVLIIWPDGKYERE